MEFIVSNNSGILYVIATPIGNLQDISFRAKQILQEVDLILAEDTRHSKILLEHLHIKTPMQSYHEFNEHTAIPDLLTLLKRGSRLALISDAGTPLLCDPGYPLIKAAHEHDIKLVPIPGPGAVLSALSISGMAADKFVFEGFLSGKSATRRKRLQELTRDTRTLVFYEAPHRILNFLQEIRDIFGADRLVCVCRELTKKFETIYRDSCGKVLEILASDPMQQKGEFVVILAGAAMEQAQEPGAVRRIVEILLKHGIPVKQASSIAAEITGARKNELYELALQLSTSNR